MFCSIVAMVSSHMCCNVEPTQMGTPDSISWMHCTWYHLWCSLGWKGAGCWNNGQGPDLSNCWIKKCCLQNFLIERNHTGKRIYWIARLMWTHPKTFFTLLLTFIRAVAAVETYHHLTVGLQGEWGNRGSPLPLSNCVDATVEIVTSRWHLLWMVHANLRRRLECKCEQRLIFHVFEQQFAAHQRTALEHSYCQPLQMV